MKNKFPQLLTLVSKIDRNHIQLAYFAFIMVGLLITQSPSDGGTGPR
jgi:hypothetical protein